MNKAHSVAFVIIAHSCATLAFAQAGARTGARAAARAAAQAAQAAQPLNTQLHTLLTTEYAAIASADTAVVRTRLADDLVWVVVNDGSTVGKSQLIAAVAHVQTPIPRFEIDSLRVTLIAGAAVAEYRRTDHRDLDAYRTQTTSRVLDVFRRQNKSWVLARHTQTWIVSSPAPVTVDSAQLDAFVGRYEIGPGYIDNVHWEGGHLVAQSTVESAGATLVPVSSTAFSPNGVAPMIVFERDAAGRVTGYVQQIPDGRVIRARRLAATHPR